MVTVIGIITLLLSIIAFFKSEKWLLNLVIVCSVFTAAIAFIEPITILPFEIPMILLLLKYAVDFIKEKKKITLNDIKEVIRTNKVFTAILCFAIALTLSELWLLISGLNYDYYDYLYKENRTITFTLYNLSQYIRHMFYNVFALAISIKVKDKNEIKGYLKVFIYASIFAVIWGFIQHILYSLNIPYPAFIFNNNPYAYQGFDQIMANFNRVNSIALEPSTFALHMAVFVPFVLIPWVFSETKKNRKIFMIAVLAITCGLLSFSSTFILSVFVEFFILFFVIVFSKNKNKKTIFLRYVCVALISIAITFGIGVLSSHVRNIVVLNSDENISNVDDKNNSDANNEIIDEETKTTQSESQDVIKTFIDVTLKKLSSGSAEERFDREKKAMDIFKQSPIFGVGVTSFRTFTLFTNVLVNNGVIGLIAIVYVFYVVIRITIKKRKEDYLAATVVIFALIGMLVPFMSSIPDLSFIYCWIIICLAYNYFNHNDGTYKEKKNKIVIGIDARGLDNNRTGITTYIEKIIEQYNNVKNKNIEFILYSSKPINLDFELNKHITKKVFSEYKKGTVFLRYRLPKILYEDGVDVFWGTQHVLPIRNKYTKNIKFVVTVHDLAIHIFGNVGNFKNTIIQKLYLKRSCKEANMIVADSISTKNDIVKFFGINKDKIKVVYLGTNFNSKYEITPNEEKKILKKFNILDKNYLFFVSTIEPRKNIVTLVKAFEVLKEENKTLKLILAGGLGWKYEDTIQSIENSKYKKDINLAGYVSKEEKECLMHNCKCLTYPSLYEGFGLPVLEAMSKGAIVVTSNNSSLPEVGGDVAFYYNNVLDYNELASVIKKVLDISETEKKKIIKIGINQANKFTWDKCANETLNILLEMVK